MNTKYTCCGRISLGAFYGTKLCGKTAKFDRDGRHYCGTHDPVTSAKKQAAKTAAWKAEWAAKDAARDAAKAKQAEIERRADCYSELLEALKDICQAYAWLTFGECRGWSNSKPLTMQESLDKAKATIAKATGDQA